MLLLASTLLADAPAFARIPTPAETVGATRFVLDETAVRTPDTRALQLGHVPGTRRLDDALRLAPGALVRGDRVIGFTDEPGYTLVVDGVRRMEPPR